MSKRIYIALPIATRAKLHTQPKTLSLSSATNPPTPPTTVETTEPACAC